MQVHQVYNWLVLHYMTYKICQAVTLNPIHKRKRKKKQAGAAYNTFLIYFHLPLENRCKILKNNKSSANYSKTRA